MVTYDRRLLAPCPRAHWLHTNNISPSLRALLHLCQLPELLGKHAPCQHPKRCPASSLKPDGWGVSLLTQPALTCCLIPGMPGVSDEARGEDVQVPHFTESCPALSYKEKYIKPPQCPRLPGGRSLRAQYPGAIPATPGVEKFTLCLLCDRHLQGSCLRPNLLPGHSRYLESPTGLLS